MSGGKLSLGAKWLGISLVCVGMASCAMTEAPKSSKPRSKEYFSEKEYGVRASPRVVADGRPVPKGGGRFMVGDPYQVKGKTYVPKEDPNYNKSGLASWYGSAFHGRLTANGEVYDSASITAAHPTFPLPSYARVTNMDNGSSVIVRVNDRGPYHPGRIIDVSEKTAQLLDIKRVGTANVNVQYVGRARMDGQDTPFLMASYIRKGDRLPSIRPEGQIASGVMVASNQTLRDQIQSYSSSMPSPVAFAGRTPSGPAPAAQSKEPFQAVENFSGLPHSGPMPTERPVGGSTRPPAPAYAANHVVQPQPEQARAPQARTDVASYAQPVQARQSQAQPTATAYAEPAGGRAPQVMFGNMILEGPRPAQKPVR